MQLVNNFHLSTSSNDYRTKFFIEKYQNLHNFQFHESKTYNIFIKPYEDKENSMKNVAIPQEQTHKKNNNNKSFEIFLVKKRNAKPFKSPS